MGNIDGELLLKRQFTIENGQLEDLIDIDLTTNDTFLQSSLEAHSDDRLKDIASTRLYIYYNKEKMSLLANI